MKVNRELRGGATQSPEALNLARERSGGSVRCTLLRMSPLTDPHDARQFNWNRCGNMGRSWAQLGALLLQQAMRQKEWYRGGVTRRLFHEMAGFCVVQVMLVSKHHPGETLRVKEVCITADCSLSTCCRQQWAGISRAASRRAVLCKEHEVKM